MGVGEAHDVLPIFLRTGPPEAFFPLNMRASVWSTTITILSSINRL